MFILCTLTQCCTAVDRKAGIVKVKLNKNLYTIVRVFSRSFTTLDYFRVRAGFGLDLVGPLTALGDAQNKI